MTATDRLAAWAGFQASVLPTDALEDWRYSRIDQLDLGCYAPVPDGDVAPVSPDAAPPAPVAGLLAALGPASLVVVVRDGRAVTTLGGDAALHLDTAPHLEQATAVPDALGAGAAGADAFAQAGLLLCEAPLRLAVDRGAVVRAPVVVVHWVEAEGAAVFPRLHVELGQGAQATVVEAVCSADVDCLVVPVTELALGPGANLGYVHLQHLGRRGWQVGTQRSEVARDATLTSLAVALGGDYARLATSSTLAGPGASTRLLGLYFGVGRQMHDFRTVQAHAAPRTTSDLLYKGAVANHSHSVYSGLIRVEKGARGTNAFQTNRNLVLNEGAHADSVPNLEIEDNDVHCSHASAVGPIAEDQRFYLESRGVPPEVGDRLIALGFLDEVLERSPAPTLAPYLRQALATKLAEALEAEREDAGVSVAPTPELARLPAADVAPGTAQRVEAPPGAICVVRIGDDVYAIGDRCSHANVPLSEGEIDSDERLIECWKHGSAFSLVDGLPQSLPATRPVPVYEASIEGADIVIRAGTSQAGSSQPAWGQV